MPEDGGVPDNRAFSADHRRDALIYPANGGVRSSVLDAMLMIVFFLCFTGSIVLLIGIIDLNNGIWMSSVHEYVESGEAGSEILKGIVNMLIGASMIFGSYFFVRHTVESAEWWQRLRP